MKQSLGFAVGALAGGQDVGTDCPWPASAHQHDPMRRLHSMIEFAKGILVQRVLEVSILLAALFVVMVVIVLFD